MSDYESLLASKEFLDAIVAEDFEEEVYAGLDTVADGVTKPQKVKAGTIEAGYDAVVMGVAVTAINEVKVFLKRKDKQVYDDGLETAGLAGEAAEVPLFVKLQEKDAWELGLTNSSGGSKNIAWRLRIRKFKKGA